MIPAPLAPDEADRLAALRALNVLDTVPEPEFDRIAAMAKAVSGAPIALVTLLDAQRNWFKAKVGTGDVCESPRDISFCQYAIRGETVFWVADTTQDPRFATSPLVADGPRLRFYAGAPITLLSGHRVGTVCVMDVQPRPFDETVADALTDLARIVGERLELRRLRYLELLSRNITETTTDAIICVDARGRINFWNGAAETVFGWSQAQALGGSLDMIIPEAHRAAHHGGFARLLAGGAPRLIGRAVEVPGLHKAGHELPIELTLSSWGTGEDRGVGAIIRDVTARKQAEEELRRARDAAEAASRAKDAFLANMSHEIRTPLNGVLGLTGALALSPLAADQRLMLQTIEDSGRELERMLTSVLELVGADSGAAAPRNTRIDVPGLLESVRQAHLAVARAKGLELRIVGASAAGAVLADEGRIRDVLSRLLDNAVKFTAAGSITLEAQLEAAGPRVRARFIVRDTGVGFDPADAERLFARFQQADGSSTRRFGGSGLGLAVCRSLAAAMGGTVEATSAPGQGASFALTLELEGQVAAAPAAPAERALRVLLAEDHPVNRQVVELILADAGVDLTCVENGAEAVDASATAEFDLVLMDVQMPVMDGLTAIRAIRARETAGGARRTPIYTLTANAMAQDAAAALAAGADEHLTKPISAARLVAAVRRAAPGGVEVARAA